MLLLANMVYFVSIFDETIVAPSKVRTNRRGCFTPSPLSRKRRGSQSNNSAVGGIHILAYIWLFVSVRDIIIVDYCRSRKSRHAKQNKYAARRRRRSSSSTSSVMRCMYCTTCSSVAAGNNTNSYMESRNDLLCLHNNAANGV